VSGGNWTWIIIHWEHSKNAGLEPDDESGDAWRWIVIHWEHSKDVFVFPQFQVDCIYGELLKNLA
jgi:hypothetical protein